MTWSHEELAEAVAAGLARREESLRREQAVRGLDALSELEMHPVVSQALRDAGLGVWREVPFPGEAGRRARRAERERCDFVLTHAPDQRVRDPMELLADLDAAAATLFGATSPPEARPGIEPEDAYWLELKTVGQFTYIDGVPVPNRSYASAFTGSLAADLRKLAREKRVHHAGVLLVLFTDERATAEHDLTIALHRCLDRGAEFRSPVVRHVGVADRAGNRSCSVVLVPRA